MQTNVWVTSVFAFLVLWTTDRVSLILQSSLRPNYLHFVTSLSQINLNLKLRYLQIRNTRLLENIKVLIMSA